MSITEIPLKGISTVIKHKKKPEPTVNHPDLCGFFFRLASIAQSNSGKTYSICSFIKQYEKYGITDCNGDKMELRTIWFSPTSHYSSNSIITTLESLDGDDILEDVDENIIKEYFEMVKTEKETLKKKDAYIKAYKNFVKIKDPSRLKIEDILLLGEYNFEPPNTIFGNLKNYMYVFVLDDVIGSATSVIGMKKNNFINNLVIKARHYQINLIFCVQQIKYLPPIIRNNLTIIQLFASASDKVLQAYYDEVSNLLTYDEFLQIFHHATKEKYGSLIINNSINAKYRFMSDWSKAITINGKG